MRHDRRAADAATARRATDGYPIPVRWWRLLGNAAEVYGGPAPRMSGAVANPDGYSIAAASGYLTEPTPGVAKDQAAAGEGITVAVRLTVTPGTNGGLLLGIHTPDGNKRAAAFYRAGNGQVFQFQIQRQDTTYEGTGLVGQPITAGHVLAVELVPGVVGGAACYVDGILAARCVAATRTVAQLAADGGASGIVAGIGAPAWTVSGGRFADLAIWDRLLTPAEHRAWVRKVTR